MNDTLKRENLTQYTKADLPLSEKEILKCLESGKHFEFIIEVELDLLIFNDIDGINEIIDLKIIQEYEYVSAMLVDISYSIDSKVDEDTIALLVCGSFEEI